MIISTLGGSMNRREKFIDEGDDEEGSGVSGEIVRRVGPRDGESERTDSGSGGSLDDAGGGDDFAAPQDDSGAPGGTEGDEYAGSPGMNDSGDGAESDGGDATGGGGGMIPETRGLPTSDEGSDSSASASGGDSPPVLEAFDGDMWAAY